VAAFTVMSQPYALRAANDAEQRRERQALSATLDRVRDAVLIGVQMRIDVRRHAELRDEQRQRQCVGDQAAMFSEQDQSLRR
jgi:hypothetical protein